MKTKIPFLTLVLLAAVALAAPSRLEAKDKKSPAPEASASPAASPAMKKPRAISFHGKVASLDVAAKTITVGKRTFKVMAETTITKAGAPAKLSELNVGEAVSGSYWKKEDGTLEAKMVRIGGAAKSGEATATPAPSAQKREGE